MGCTGLAKNEEKGTLKRNNKTGVGTKVRIRQLVLVFIALAAALILIFAPLQPEPPELGTLGVTNTDTQALIMLLPGNGKYSAVLSPNTDKEVKAAGYYTRRTCEETGVIETKKEKIVYKIDKNGAVDIDKTKLAPLTQLIEPSMETISQSGLCAGITALLPLLKTTGLAPSSGTFEWNAEAVSAGINTQRWTQALTETDNNIGEALKIYEAHNNLYMEQIKQVPTLEFILGNNNTLTTIVAYSEDNTVVGGFKFSDA